MGRTSPPDPTEVVGTADLLAEARTLATRIVQIVEVLEADMEPNDEPA